MKRLFKYIFLIIITIILFASNKVYAEEWIGECYYGQETGNKNYNVSFKFNRYNIDIDVENVQFSRVDFDLEDVLNYYDEHGDCPEKLYRHDIPGDPNPNSSPLQIIDLTSGSRNLKCYKNIIHKENDNWLTNNEDAYSNCYYQLSTGDCNDCYAQDLININFNKNEFNVQVVDSDLKYKSGLSLTYSDSVSPIKIGGWDINLADLQDYYTKNSSGCPTAIGWDKDGILFLLNNPGNHEQKHGYELKLNKDKSTSKNLDTNLDGSDLGIDPTLPDITECEYLLGKPDDPGAPAYYIEMIFHIIKYIALVLMIVLSVMDFTGAVAKQDKDALAKVLKKIMLRFILCIVLFLLPYFINLLLNYLVERQTDLCGIK